LNFRRKRSASRAAHFFQPKVCQHLTFLGEPRQIFLLFSPPGRPQTVRSQNASRGKPRHVDTFSETRRRTSQKFSSLRPRPAADLVSFLSMKTSFFLILRRRFGISARPRRSDPGRSPRPPFRRGRRQGPHLFYGSKAGSALPVRHFYPRVPTFFLRDFRRVEPLAKVEEEAAESRVLEGQEESRVSDETTVSEAYTVAPLSRGFCFQALPGSSRSARRKRSRAPDPDAAGRRDRDADTVSRG